MAATATASTIRYAPEDPNLPKPWKGLVDSRTGYLYFWNPETNVTQYERPPGLAPPVSSPVQTQQQPSSGYSSGKDDDKYSKGSDEPKTDSVSRFSEVLICVSDLYYSHCIFIHLGHHVSKALFSFGTGKQKWTNRFK